VSFTYDLTTNVGLIRLRITDKSEAEPIYQDEELAAFYTAEGSVLRASAAALEAIAINQALVLKVLKLLQLSTDGAKLADTLLKLAQHYRNQAEFEDAASGGNFDWAETIDNEFAARERIVKELMRG
jgi:hypothetical protein